MTDPHLLPHQIDLLVDGDAGPGARPLREHLAGCDACGARLVAAQRAAEAIAAMPHFAPRLPFADHVMAKVQVTEPWHVALTEDALSIVPTSGPVRSVAAAGAILSGLLFAALSLWLALRWDLASWLLHLGAERVREVASEGAGSLAAAALGARATGAGVWPLAMAGGVLVATAVLAALGFRRLAAASRAKRG
jgi:hypothetical protein